MAIEVNRLEWDALIRDSQFQAQLNRMENRLDGLANNAVQAGNTIDGVFSRLAKAAAGFLTLNAAQGFVRELINVRSEFQQLDIAFTTMLGSKAKADQLTKDLIQFAAFTPFGMKDAANAAKQLLAYGSSVENVRDELQMLGDVASGVSQPIGDLVYLYGTLRTQGRAYMMDIRQFAGRGIPIYKELANVLGVSVDRVNDFISEGKVGFAEVEKAFQNMTAAGSMFGGLMEQQSQTIKGELERLGDAWDLMLNKIGADTEGMISGSIQGLSFLVENYESVLTILTSLIVVYGAYRAALIATAALYQLQAARVVGMTTVEMLHLGAITAKTAAMRVLNAVMAASPVLALTAAISAMAAIIYSLTQVTNAAAIAQEKLNDAIDAGNKAADVESRKISQLVDVLKDNAASAEQKKVAYDKLLQQTKGIVASFTQEEIATGKATETLNTYIESIKEAASARKAFDEFNAMSDALDELNRNGIDSIGTWTKLGRSLKNTFIPTSQGIGFSEWIDILFSGDAMSETIVGQEREVLEAAMDELKKAYGDKWNELVTGVKPEAIEAPVIKVSEALNDLNNKIAQTEADLKKALAPDAAYDKGNIDKLKDSLKELKAERDILLGISSETKKAEKELAKYRDAQQDILQDILDRRADLAEKSLSQNDRELSQTSRFYEELRGKIEEHNNKVPALYRIGSGTLSMLDNLEKEERGFLISEQQVEKDLENIGKLENAYDQLAELSKRINSLQGEQSVLGLSPAKESALRQYLELFNELQEIQRTEAFDLSKNHNQRLEEIELEHQARVRALGANATQDQIRQLERVRDEAIKIANETEAQKLSIVLKGTQAQLVVTVASLRAQSRAIVKLLESDNLPDKLRESLEQRLKAVDNAMYTGSRAATIANFKARQQELVKELDKLEKAGLKNTEVWQQVYDELVLLSQESEEYASEGLQAILDMVFRLASELDELGSGFSDLGDAFGSDVVSGIGGMLSGLASNLQNISIALDENAEKSDKYAAAISSLIGMISMVASAAAERKRAEEEYYRSVIQLQNDYNISLIEQQRLQAELGESIYLTDYVGRMQSGLAAGKSAMDGYRQALENLINTGKIKDGMKNAVNWNNVGKGASTGAAIGAVVGSIIPGIGTAVVGAVGAAVGAVVGGLIGLFGGKKKKETYSSLISQYPQLKEYLNADSPQDLAEIRALAEALIKNNATDASTKQQLENIVGFIEQLEAAREQIRAVVQDLSGDLGNELRNTLVEAFQSGENAGVAMARTVGGALEQMLSQLLFNKAFEGIFKTFEDELTDAISAYGLTGDEGVIIDAMGDFIDKAGPAAENFYRWLELAKQQADNQGLDIFKPQDQSGGLSGRINRTIEETTASEILGFERVRYDLASRHLAIAAQMYAVHQEQLIVLNRKLAVLNSINSNTAATVQRLDTAVTHLSSIVNNTKPASARNLGV